MLEALILIVTTHGNMKEEPNLFLTVVFDIPKTQYEEIVNEVLKLGAVTIERGNVVLERNTLIQKLEELTRFFSRINPTKTAKENLKKQF